MNGNYLVIVVSIAVILPLALMKQLGEYLISHLYYNVLPISLVFQCGNLDYVLCFDLYNQVKARLCHFDNRVECVFSI